MSVPKNHHYVSQVHIKNFFNTEKGRIYMYDKIRGNLYDKTTSKTIYSEEFSNSKYKDGEIDHVSLEAELNNFFEKDFASNTLVIKDYAANRTYTQEVNEALIYFAKYGIVSEMRTPRHKKESDGAIFDIFREIQQNAAPELKKQIDDALQFQNHVKYSNALSYVQTAERILAKMGNLIFQVLVADETDFFFLPDFGAATVREKINSYFNSDAKEIAYIGLPLTSKIYLNFYSEKLHIEGAIQIFPVINCTSDTVQDYNQKNLDYCEGKIACENESYLSAFIKSQSVKG